MKKILSLILVSLGFAFAGTFYNNTAPSSVPRMVQPGGFSYLVADVQLNASDTVYTQVYDMMKMPLFMASDTIGRLVIDSASIGDVIASCYDVNDSAAVVDSVIVTITHQQNLFAGNGVNPSSSFSGTWDSAGTAITLAAASDANTQVKAVSRPPLKLKPYRFMRWRLVNISGSAKNIPRCRLIWQRRNSLPFKASEPNPSVNP